MIGLTRKPPEQDKKYELHRLLGTLLSDEMEAQEKAEIIEKEYHITMSDEMRKVTLEQIADVAHKSVAETEEIIKARSLMSV